MRRACYRDAGEGMEAGAGRNPVLAGVALAGLLLATGCSPHAGGDADHGHDHGGHEASAAAAYKAGHGVRLGEAAAAFVGLRLGDVETRDLTGAAGATVIPRAALLHTVRGVFVFVENGGWLLRSPVTPGVASDDWVEIRDGLYEGDRIAVAGVEALWLAEISAVNGGVGCADGH